MADKLQLLTLRSLAELDNNLERDFESVLQSLVKDCMSRPSIRKTRELKLLVQVVPVLNQDGSCDDVIVDVQVASKAPAKVVPSVTMRATVNGGLRWNKDSPDNPSQSTLGFDPKDEE